MILRGEEEDGEGFRFVNDAFGETQSSPASANTNNLAILPARLRLQGAVSFSVKTRPKASAAAICAPAAKTPAPPPGSGTPPG